MLLSIELEERKSQKPIEQKMYPDAVVTFYGCDGDYVITLRGL